MTASAESTPTGAALRFNLYGRRLSRALRPAQAQRFETLMPRLALTLPRQGHCNLSHIFTEAKAGYALEIGFGAGEHLIARAVARPDWGFVGAEFYRNGLASALYGIEQQGSRCDNIRLFEGDARLIMEKLPDDLLSAVYILFPDPWPKLRQWRRRLLSGATFAMLARVMKRGATLYLASDHPDYQSWIMRELLASPYFDWQPRGADDWRRRPADWPATRYERKALREGRPCLYLQAIRTTGNAKECQNG